MATEAKYITTPSGKNNPECGIKAYLDKVAMQDALFALKYMDGKKTIVGAIQYIMHVSMSDKPTSNVKAHIKNMQVDGKRFGFIDTDNDLDHQLAYSYFMDDTLMFEPTEKPAAPAAPATPAAQPAAPKAATPKAAKPKAAKPKTVATPTPQPKEDDEVIDLFAGLF